MKNRLNMAACGLPLLLCLVTAAADATTLEQALAAAESYSSELAANGHQVNALNNMADAATELPDPKLQFGIENVPVAGNNGRRFTREEMTMQKVGLMQEYVSSAKRERKSEIIRSESRKTEANAQAIRARLQRDTAQAWLELALSENTLATVETLIAETSRQVHVQKASAAGDDNNASRVLDIQLALNAMKNEEDIARRDVQVAQSALMKLTGQSITAVSGAFPRITRLPADEKVLTDSIARHPEIIQASREADIARARTSLSAVAAIPDVGIEVYYAKRASGLGDMAGVMFTVDLPLFQGKRQDKDLAADVSRTYEANEQLTLLMREHQAELHSLISQYHAAKAIYDRQVNTVIPLLQAKVKFSEAQYRAQNTGLAEILEARRARLNGEIEKNNAEKNLASAWSAIRYLIPQEVK